MNENGYIEHYCKAKREFVDWYYRGHVDDVLSDFYFTNCYAIDDMLVYDDELKLALQGFDECIQIKILWHYDIGEHCLKIKWEHSPYWTGQVLHFYYCVMLPLDTIALKSPSQLICDALGEEE